MAAKYAYLFFVISCCLMFSHVIAQEGEEVERQEAPAPGSALLSSSSRRCVNGLFIICERRNSGIRTPEARVFTSINPVGFSFTPRCTQFSVSGRVGANSQFNHARLWQSTPSEFNELNSYFETLVACTNGTIRVRIRSSTVYTCSSAFEAHIVRFGYCS